MMMETLYKEIFDNKTLGRAISKGQSILHKDPNRLAALGMKIELEDWMLPVIFQREEIDFQIKRPSISAQVPINNYHEKLPLPRFGFKGRDLDILRIEKMLLSVNHLLVRGMIGVGKSALLKYLYNWWAVTNFRNIQKAIYIDWRKKELTHSAFINLIAEQIFSKNDLKVVKKKTIEERKIIVLRQLNQKPYAIILDNIFQFSNKKIINFLSQITGRSFVVYGSVNSEEELSATTFREDFHQLDGLDQNAAYELADTIIQKTAEKDFQKLMKSDKKIDLEHLLKLLSGFPSAMELVLPCLKHQTVEAVLEGFREGTLDLKLD